MSKLTLNHSMPHSWPQPVMSQEACPSAIKSKTPAVTSLVINTNAKV